MSLKREGAATIHRTRELFSRSCPSRVPKKLTWTPESVEAIHFSRIAVSNCQELYFLEDSATDWCIWLWYRGLHVYCDKWTSPRHSFLQQIPHWITVELVGQGKRMLFEDLLDNRILHILMWHSLVRSYDGSCTCRVRTLIYSMFPARKNINLYLMHYPDCVRIMYLHLLLWLTDA